MVHLLKSTFSKQTAKICEDHVETMNLHKIQQNVFVVEQRFGRVLAKIIIANQAALIEISCKQGQLIKNTRGLGIFLITLDCSFNLNGMRLVEADPSENGFQPQLIYMRNDTLTKEDQSKLNPHTISNSSILLSWFS